MIAGITYGTYLLFGCLTFLGAAFVWFFVPETKRLTLEEMVSSPRLCTVFIGTQKNNLLTGSRM